MARYVLPIAGAVVGGIFGGPMGAQLGWGIGSALGGAIDPQVIKGPSIGDIAQQTSQEGVPRPIVFGLSQPLAGNIIATSEPNIVRRRERQGKGGPKVETESVYRTYAIRICEGPIVGVLRVWRNNQLVYDARPNTSLTEEDNAKFLDTARFFLGDFAQDPSPDLEAVFGAGTTPAHRGTAYMVMANEDLTDLRGAIPSYQFQVTSTGTSAAVLIAVNNSHASQRIARSEDGGETWDMVTTPEAGGQQIDWESVAFSPTLNRLVCVGNRSVTGGIEHDTMYSDDFGETWTTYDSGLENAGSNFWANIKWIPDNGGYFIASVYSSSGTVNVAHIRTSPTGLPGSWTGALIPGTSQGASMIAYAPTLGVSGRLVVAISSNSNDTDVAYSDDHGATWTRVTVGMTWQLDGFGHPTGVCEWDPQRNRFLLCNNSGSSFTPFEYSISATGLAGSWTAPDEVGIFANNTETWAGAYLPNEGGILVSARGGSSFPYAQFALFTTAWPGATETLIDSVNANHCYAINYDENRDRTMMLLTRTGANDYFGYRLFAGDSWELVELPVNAAWTDVIACSGVNLDAIPLPDLVESICERVGMTSEMFDVSQLDSDIEVPGITMINTYPAYTALQALSQIYFFSPSYYDGVLHFVSNGGNSVATITEDDMLDDHEIEIEENLRDDPISLPRVMHVLYYDVDGGLATDKQTSERAGDYRAKGEQSIQSPVVMEATTAARAIAINHKVSIENLRGTLRFCLPDSWIRLVPSDPVIVQSDGQSRRARLTKVEILDGYQQYEALRDRQSAYTSEVEGIPAAVQTPPPSNVVGPTLIQPLDIHIIRDADDNLGLIYYVAISGTRPAWTGALVELSLDGGANYVDALSSTIDTIMGELHEPLHDHPQEYPDETNTIVVSVQTPYAEFDETDLAGLLNRQNFAIVGDEIVQFAEADEIVEGRWALSLLLRGRKGTQTNYWPAGTRFVMLDTASLGVIPASLLDIGRTLTFRATSFGETIDTATVVSMVYEGRSQIERAVAYLQATLDGTDAVVSWQGVGRLGGGALVAHGVRFAGYRVTFTGDNAAVITVDTDEQELTQDVSTLTQPITISVVQLNDLTGGGPAVEVII